MHREKTNVYLLMLDGVGGGGEETNVENADDNTKPVLCMPGCKLVSSGSGSGEAQGGFTDFFDF